MRDGNIPECVEENCGREGASRVCDTECERDWLLRSPWPCEWIPWSRDCEGEAVVREPASVRRAETAGRCANAGMQLLGAVETSDSCWDSEC